MNLFVDNTFSTNHYISMSDKIKKISMFFLYFNTIEHVKCLDEDYRKITNDGLTSERQRDIKYKILGFRDAYTTDGVNTVFQSSKFGKCLYHLFYSANILHENQMSFTITHFNDMISEGSEDSEDSDTIVKGPFVIQSNNAFPLLNDYSYSFYFPIINHRNAKLFFSRSLLTNPYICIDVFLITYLLHFDIHVFTREHLMDVSELYMKERMMNDKNLIIKSLEYFIDYEMENIIVHLLQFKYTWTYFSFCYFFVLYYPEKLQDNGLYELFLRYIQDSSVERNPDIVKDIHTILFTI